MNEYFNLLGKCHQFNIVTQKKEKTRKRERNIKTITILLIAFRIIESICVLHQSDNFHCLIMLVTSYKSFDQSINACYRFMYIETILS
jgi:hypothetical protein